MSEKLFTSFTVQFSCLGKSVTKTGLNPTAYYLFPADETEKVSFSSDERKTYFRWISDMGINGPTFVPKSDYFLPILTKVCPQKLAFS